MEELLNGLVAKCGIDKATAEKVIAFLKDNATKLPQWLAGNDTAKAIADKVGLGGFLK